MEKTELSKKYFLRFFLRKKLCCEFGAWDGIWASNCRNLIMNNGWKAIMIEGDSTRYKDLLKTYHNNINIRCLNNYVDNAENSLNNLLTEYEKQNIDFLSIDIDGLDYEIFENIAFSPKVICIEVNTCHSPENGLIIPREIAQNNVGQPLPYFVDIANAKGYKLVCFTGNAIFVRNELLEKSNLKSISSKKAYLQHLAVIPNHVKEHLYFVNKGITYPYHKYENPFLTKAILKLSTYQITIKLISVYWKKLIGRKISLINIIKYKLSKR